MQYRIIKQQIKHLSKEEYITLKLLCRISKNLKNQTLYEIRQEYFNNKKYLNFLDAYKILKNSKNYKLLNANMAQQIMKKVDAEFKSFFGLLRLKQKGNYQNKVKIPNYLDKNGYNNLIIQQIPKVVDGYLTLPMSITFKKDHNSIKIKVPKVLLDKKVKEIRIIPKYNARFFEIQYIYEIEEDKRELNKNNALAIDLGINNLCTCITSEGKSFIVDGKRLKSINQWFNKENARLQSIKDKQKFGKLRTRRQYYLLRKRNNRVNDYMAKTAKLIINYCLENNIGQLVLGMNKDFQREASLSKKNNQSFTQIPFGKLKEKFKYLCEYYGIIFTEQEESYTSKASFWDKDEIPIFGKKIKEEYVFSGKRVKRGLYKTSKGYYLNADCNGALNILRKSKVVDLTVLYNRGVLDTPKRIRIA